MRLLLYLFIVWAVLISCSNDQERLYTYHSNGEIKEEIEINDDSVANGLYKKYYENGQLEEISQMSNGHYNGYSLSYYPNGKLKNSYNLVEDIYQGEFSTYYENGNIEYSGAQKDNFPYGQHFEYYELDSGKIWYESYYVIVGKEEVVVKQTEYNLSGQAITTSSYVEVTGLPDTVSLDDKVDITLTLKNKKGDFINYFVGDFNENFSGYSKIDTLRASVAGAVIISLYTNNKGSNYIRGVVYDESIVRREGDRIYTQGYPRYFEIYYYVK